MKIQTQFTVPKKEMGAFKHHKRIKILEKNFNMNCLDYPSKQDCLVCCN